MILIGGNDTEISLRNLKRIFVGLCNYLTNHPEVDVDVKGQKICLDNAFDPKKDTAEYLVFYILNKLECIVKASGESLDWKAFKAKINFDQPELNFKPFLSVNPKLKILFDSVVSPGSIPEIFIQKVPEDTFRYLQYQDGVKQALQYFLTSKQRVDELFAILFCEESFTQFSKEFTENGVFPSFRIGSFVFDPKEKHVIHQPFGDWSPRAPENIKLVLARAVDDRLRGSQNNMKLRVFKYAPNKSLSYGPFSEKFITQCQHYAKLVFDQKLRIDDSFRQELVSAFGLVCAPTRVVLEHWSQRLIGVLKLFVEKPKLFNSSAPQQKTETTGPVGKFFDESKVKPEQSKSMDRTKILERPETDVGQEEDKKRIDRTI